MAGNESRTQASACSSTPTLGDGGAVGASGWASPGGWGRRCGCGRRWGRVLAGGAGVNLELVLGNGIELGRGGGAGLGTGAGGGLGAGGEASAELAAGGGASDSVLGVAPGLGSVVANGMPARRAVQGMTMNAVREPVASPGGCT